MKLTVNGEAIDSTATTLADLLDHLGQGDAKVATAVNGNFVPATARAEQALHPGDTVEIVTPRQGG